MAYDFPDNPNPGDQTPDGKWSWDGTAWVPVGSASSGTPVISNPAAGLSQTITAADPADIPLGLNCAENQSANLLELRDSDSNILNGFDKDGNLINGGGGGGGGLTISDTPPPTPSPGDLWMDSSDTDMLTYAWYDDGDSQQWVLQSDPKNGFRQPAPTKRTRVTISANQTVTNATGTFMLWDTVDGDDTGGFWLGDVSGAVFTIPEGVTKVIFRASTHWNAQSVGDRLMTLQKWVDPNATTVAGGIRVTARAGTTYSTTLNGGSAAIDVTPGDQFLLLVSQTTGANLAVIADESTWFEIEEVL